MAGDIDLLECLMIPSNDQTSRMLSALPVIHEYGNNVRIASGRNAVLENNSDISDYSPIERLGLEAFRQRSSERFIAQKKERPFASAKWGDPNVKAPLHSNQATIVRGEPVDVNASSHSNSPEAKRLAGRIAVGIIIVSGPGSLAMSASNQTKVVAEVQNGLSFLASRAPAKDVTFVHDIKIPTINVTNVTSNPSVSSSENDKYEHYEQPWRDAALKSMGYSSGYIGIRDYIKTIKSGLLADAAYCVFFTHYDLYHFAYCSGSYITMNYSNDGWGPDNLDRVFAHETGHIFGAPDEYKESGCNCAGSWGVYNKPNLNCESCAENGGVPCIMKANTWEMCTETPYHLGYTMKTV